jgi:hypothetical protein
MQERAAPVASAQPVLRGPMVGAMTALAIAISDALTVLADKTIDEEARLRQLEVRLGFAAAAADDEINMLAVEGLQQTLEDAIADADHRAFLLGELQETMAAYSMTLIAAGDEA